MTRSLMFLSLLMLAAAVFAGAGDGLPVGSGAAEPFLFAAKDSLLLSWLEPVANSKDHALRFSRYRNGRWSTPATITQRNDLFVNWADFPSIVEDTNGALYAHWLQKSGSATYAYDVRVSISRDGGKKWQPSFVLNRDGKQAEHGFVTLAPLKSGGVGATWLDGRKMVPGKEEGDMTIRYATIDAKGQIGGDVELDARTCECCTTGMAMTDAGPVVLYRDRTKEEIRDISYSRLNAKRWSAPRGLNADGWKIAGCPVNGPQADAIGNIVATGWFTAANDRARAYVAFSADGGGTFGKPIVVDDGKPLGRMDVVLLDPKTALVTWLEVTPTGAEIRARRVSADGKRAQSMKIADSSAARGAGFTRLARSGRTVYFAWTEQSASSKTIRLAERTF